MGNVSIKNYENRSFDRKLQFSRMGKRSPRPWFSSFYYVKPVVFDVIFCSIMLYYELDLVAISNSQESNIVHVDRSMPIVLRTYERKRLCETASSRQVESLECLFILNRGRLGGVVLNVFDIRYAYAVNRHQRCCRVAPRVDNWRLYSVLRERQTRAALVLSTLQFLTKPDTSTLPLARNLIL